MVFAKPAALGMCMWATTLVVAASASAQSQTCADGSSLWSSAANGAAVGGVAVSGDVSLVVEVENGVEPGVVSAVAISATVDEIQRVPVVVTDDVQWCVDSNDPRCLPDPVGAPAAHLSHAGDVGQPARHVVIAPPAATQLGRDDRQDTRAASGYRDDLERPPQPR